MGPFRIDACQTRTGESLMQNRNSGVLRKTSLNSQSMKELKSSPTIVPLDVRRIFTSSHLGVVGSVSSTARSDTGRKVRLSRSRHAR